MKIAILAEQNFNLIDGSTIWLLNVCKLLALQSDLDPVLMLSHPLTNRVLADELPARVRVVDLAEWRATAGFADEAMRPDVLIHGLTGWENAEGAFARIFVRGTSYLERLLETAAFRGRVVGYAPSAIPDLAEPEPAWVAMGRAARVPMVVQSDAAKRSLETLSQYPANIVHVVPPIVFAPDVAPRDPDQPVTLCYSGKIDLHYGLDWLMDLCETAPQGVVVSLIAGKDTYRPRDPDFFKRMDGFRARIAAGTLPQMRLATGLGHGAALAEMARADFAWCLRHARYDDVIEISTKIVEFCRLGVPPILNDNALNRDLFGADYPYLLDITKGDLAAVLRPILASRGTAAYGQAQQRIAEVAARFSADLLSDRLAVAIRGHARDAARLTDRPRRILIATHEAKFLRQFIDRVQGDAQVQIDWQLWASTTKPATPPVLPDGVETVFCEWCCENAVWHSQNKRPGTKLIVRLHRFEAFRDFPARVNWDQVDALIVVSSHFRDLMVAEHGVDPARIHVWPQYIDWQELQRPKLPEARRTLGLVGINPFEHKRFDRAIEFLADLRRRDPRFTLAVRSVMPWEITWVWDQGAEMRARFQAVFDRIYHDPILQGAVRFDPPGPDMEEWYRGIGFILSSSDSEGCHTSVLEGMASGCHPVVHDWPGAQSLFAPHVHADLRDAIPGVIAFADLPALDRARNNYAKAVASHDVEIFTQNFMNL